MTQQEWKLSTRYLRTLIGEFERQGATASRSVKYKFALEFNPMFGYFHIWNGKSKNTMCTVRISRKKVVVRYRPGSHYRHELRKMKFDGKRMIFIPSDNLSRHRAWLFGRVQDRVEREMVRVKGFLALNDRSELSSSLPSRDIPNTSIGRVSSITIPLPVSAMLDSYNMTQSTPTEVLRYRTQTIHFQPGENTPDNIALAQRYYSNVSRLMNVPENIYFRELQSIYSTLFEPQNRPLPSSCSIN